MTEMMLEGDVSRRNFMGAQALFELTGAPLRVRFREDLLGASYEMVRHTQLGQRFRVTGELVNGRYGPELLASHVQIL